MSREICDGRQNQNRCLIGENGNVSRVPVYDIVNCGPRHRFGANGKIVSNSNWQNFKRGSDIRRSICAPEGYLLAPVDLSQVEVRVCAWLAGEEQLLETFRKHEDPYCGIASDFYGRPITKKDALERGTGKQAILSCLGPDTLVLTNSGIKPILAVQRSDKVWDGVEWVAHEGLLARGKKETISLMGLSLTPCHQVLCGSTWVEASRLHDENIRSQALATGSENLPSPATSWQQGAGSSLSLPNVPVAPPNNTSIFSTCLMAGVRGVARVLKSNAGIGANNISDTPTSFPMTSIDVGFSRAFPRLSLAVPLKMHAIGSIMEGVASGYILRGSKTNGFFSNTLSNLKAGITRISSLIAKITTKATYQAIYALQRKLKTWPTGALLPGYKKLLPTYDLACAGPRNRFTILSAAGPLIVHNCQYGSSGARFQITAKLGFYGPPVLLELETANQYVNIYRNKYTRIVQDWRDGDMALKRMANWLSFDWGILRVECNVERGTRRLYFPNGTFIVYDTIEWHEPTAEEVETKGSRSGWRVRTRHGWKNIYGSMLTQNRCEAVSRLIMTQAMIRIAQAGIRPVLSTHDEIVFLVRRDGNEERALQFCIDEMTRTPAWAPGLPLEAEGSLGDRYSK